MQTLAGGLQRFFVVAATAMALATTAALAPAHAATYRWLGGGTNGSWSDAANWSPGGLPLDGDTLIFSGNPPWLSSILDRPLSLNLLRFEPDSQQFAIHVAGSGNAGLVFSGLGVQNATGGGGPIRQEFFSDAGSTGGSITFSQGAGVNLGESEFWLPVSFFALGGSAPGMVGGRVVFEGSSSTGTSTFTALRAEGASAAGAGAGSVLFRETALSTSTAIVVAVGGSGAGSQGGQVRVTDNAQLQGRLAVRAGDGGGQGGRALFDGRAAATLVASIENEGSHRGTAGGEAVTRVSDDARLTALVTNEAGRATGAAGGRVEFHDRAALDSTGLDPALGGIGIINRGSDLRDARGGSTVFAGDSAIRGTAVYINNTIEGEGLTAGSAGGTTEFRDRSQAGSVRLRNEGATVGSFFGLAITHGGRTSFHQQASAGQASFTSLGGNVAAALGGRLDFFDDSSAGSATVFNRGALVGAAQGGLAVFSGRSTAAAAQVFNGGGQDIAASGGQLVFNADANAGSAVITNVDAVSDATGGRTVFADRARAGSATIQNLAPAGAAGGTGVSGSTRFIGMASAGSATLLNNGAGNAATPLAGHTRFEDDSSAGSATIHNYFGTSSGAAGGFTVFSQRASAGTAVVVLYAGAAGAGGGIVEFLNSASAAQAQFDAHGPTQPGAGGGVLRFFDNADAGDALIVLGGSQQAMLLGATASFSANASASRATVLVGGGGAAGASGARVDFGSGPGFVASGGQSSISNQRASVAAASGGSTLFTASSSAAQASIVNQGDDFASDPAHSAASTVFSGNASAGNATIVNEGGRVRAASGGSTSFRDTAGAGDATIDNAAGSSAGPGGSASSGSTSFSGSASAQRAQITNRAATDDFASVGGITFFSGSSSAGNARISAEGSANATRSGGRINFSGGDGGTATLLAEGATGVGGRGGLLLFGGTGNAGNATLVAGSGVAGGSGGRIVFPSATSGGSARAIIEGGAGRSPGELDISGHVLGTSLGSIEGGGVVNLGEKQLRTGRGHRNTTFSGLIRDGGSGGALLVEGNGSLTLTGDNSYRAGTLIADGSLAGRGKLVVANTIGSATGSGPVVVNRGGVLAGSGFIAGPVTLRPGGMIAPGDPVTLTLHDSLTWDGGGVIRLALGADTAGSDQLVLGDLMRGDDGVFMFELIDFGAVLGQTYELVRFDSLVGFDAGDFSFGTGGIGGNFALFAGGLLFTATAVPEPAADWLLLTGVLLLASALRTTTHARSDTKSSGHGNNHGAA